MNDIKNPTKEQIELINTFHYNNKYKLCTYVCNYMWSNEKIIPYDELCQIGMASMHIQEFSDNYVYTLFNEFNRYHKKVRECMLMAESKVELLWSVFYKHPPCVQAYNGLGCHDNCDCICSEKDFSDCVKSLIDEGVI